jgi:curli production assembly/transport component CsgG
MELDLSIYGFDNIGLNLWRHNLNFSDNIDYIIRDSRDDYYFDLLRTNVLFKKKKKWKK